MGEGKTPDEQEKRFFTVEEAEELIPRLEVVMGRLVDLDSQVTRVRDLVEEERRKIMVYGGRLLDVAEFRKLRASLEGLTTDIRCGVEKIVGMGARPKDLGQGLVDFPYLLGDREVNLCWRLGEKQIRFWHGLDEGFAGRRPLPGR